MSYLCPEQFKSVSDTASTIMKRLLYILPLVLLLMVCSCGRKTKTYAQQLKEMQESIANFMDDHGYKLTDEMPTAVPWTDKDGRPLFYKLESGLYLNIIDTGYTAGTPKGTVVCVRYTEMSVSGDSITYSNMGSGFDPAEITYGKINTSGGNSYYWGDCQAWHEPLGYVGDYGHVRIIAPNDLGMPVYDNSSVSLLAHFYELKYTFWR